MATPQRLLLVDDEPDLQQLLVFNLDAAGFAVEAVATGAAGLEAAFRERPVVVVLDLMLPDIPGTEVCRRMRSDERLEDVGILMLTARGDEYDRVLGFEVGADDYVVKPYSVRELVLRVKALARRSAERHKITVSPVSGQRASLAATSSRMVRQPDAAASGPANRFSSALGAPMM